MKTGKGIRRAIRLEIEAKAKLLEIEDLAKKQMKEEFEALKKISKAVKESNPEFTKLQDEINAFLSSSDEETVTPAVSDNNNTEPHIQEHEWQTAVRVFTNYGISIPRNILEALIFGKQIIWSGENPVPLLVDGTISAELSAEVKTYVLKLGKYLESKNIVHDTHILRALRDAFQHGIIKPSTSS